MKEKDVFQELVERYLDGTLSDTERADVERRLAADIGFRREVDLHRALQAHLGDAGEWHLRATLDDLRNAPHLHDGAEIPPSAAPGSTSRRLGWAAVIAVLLLAGIAARQWWNYHREVPAPQPAAPEQNIPAPTRGQEPSSPAGLPAPANDRPRKKSQPIAMAEPANFVSNSTLDGRIGSVRGANGAEVVLQSPASDATFRQDNGRINLLVQGTVLADTTALHLPFRLFVYSNRPEDWQNKQPLFSQPILLEPVGPESYRINFSQRLRLRPGLYYIIVGRQRAFEASDGHRTLWVGRFTVELKK